MPKATSTTDQFTPHGSGRHMDKAIRKEFAKVFRWYTVERPAYYGEEKKLKTPSWCEIFTEIGKLQDARTFYDLEGNVSEHECMLEDVFKRLNELQKDKA